MKDLLRKKQSEEMDAREAAERAERAEKAAAKEREKLHGPEAGRRAGSGASIGNGAGSGAGAAGEADDSVASQQIPELRSQLNKIVSITAQRTGRPHGAIHTEARKACGGPPTALCSADQLRDRIKYLRAW